MLDLSALNDLARHLGPHRADLDAAIGRVLTRAHFVLGAEGERFEREFAAYCGARHCAGTANGTDALELALRAVGVGPGDDVLTVANAGMYATAAILAIAARPRYVDIDPATLLIDLDDLDRALDPATHPRPAGAVVITHLYGQPADAAEAARRAGVHGVPVIEDCAQAHGAHRQGRRCGSLAAAAAFSFYPTKNLGAVGDAGAVVTDSPELAARVRELRQYGWTAKYVATRAGGRNSRLDEVQAAVLTTLLPRLEGWNERRRQIMRRYAAGIAHPDVRLPDRTGDGDAGHLFVLRTPRRDALRAHLAARGIGTDVHYPVPDHLQPAVTAAIGPTPPLPHTEAACAEVLTLPCFPELSDAEVDAVTSAIREW